MIDRFGVYVIGLIMESNVILFGLDGSILMCAVALAIDLGRI